jgi:hypothetical protein
VDKIHDYLNINNNFNFGLKICFVFFFIYDEFERGERNSSKNINKKRKLSFVTIKITKMIKLGVKMFNLKIGVGWWWYFATILPKNICQLEREIFSSLILYF